MLPSIKRVIKDYEAMKISDILHYFNLLRVLSNVLRRYNLTGKINAPIKYFVATREKSKGNMLWKKRSSKRVDYYHIDADHFSMFEDDANVKKLAFTLTSVLGNLK